MPALGDSYTKIKKIGAGAFGAAWLIKRKKDGASLVCKEVQMRGVSSKEKQNIKQEVEVLRKLKHTNIIALYDAFEDTSGVLNIIMELGDGGDLDKFLKNQKGTRLPEEKIVDLFAQICSGLAYVHRQRILHRDIKGANILLTKKGEVKLCDFGVARVLSEDTNMALTQIGTPYYLSPEVCQGRPYDDKSDVWSLGIVLYELCALRRPFEADGMPALIIKIVRGKHAPIPSNYSRELKHLIEITIRVSPAERASVDDLMSSPAVQRFLHSSKEKDQGQAPPAKPRSAEVQSSSRRPPAVNGVPSGAQRPRSNEGPTTNQAAQAARAAAALLAPPQRRVGAGYSPGGGAPAGGASPGGGGRPTIAQLGGGGKPGAAGAKAASPIGAAAAGGGAGRASRPVARPASGTKRPSREGSSEGGNFVDKGDVSRLPKNVVSAHDESDVMARDLARLLKK